jgi:hypothetical protein
MTKEQDALYVILEASSPEKRGPGYYQAVKVVGDMCEYHAAQLAALQRRGDALRDAAEATLQVGTLQTLYGLSSALAAWSSAPAPGGKAKCDVDKLFPNPKPLPPVTLPPGTIGDTAKCGLVKRRVPDGDGSINGSEMMVRPDCAKGGGA